MPDPCIDCGAEGAAAIRWSDDQFPLARCERCGFVFHARWQSELADGATFHEGNIEYYEHLESVAAGIAMNPLNLQRLSDLLDRLRADVPNASLLDVGCGRGEVVAVASSLGWESRGIDLAPGAIRIAQQHGLRCDEMDFFDSALDGARFGLIYMSEFLEHVPQPGRFLRRAKDLLAPGGRVYLTTPNFNSMGRRVLGPHWSAFVQGHVGFFARSSLAHIARGAGLRPDKVRTNGISITALEAVLRPRRSRSGPEEMPRTQEFREAVYASRWKRTAKTLVDPIIGRSGLGETLKATLVRH